MLWEKKCMVNVYYLYSQRDQDLEIRSHKKQIE